MESMDEVDDPRTFRVDFSADGLVMLKDRIGSKLNEFLGDYSDDSFVEYVILLIRNGRRKKEAKSDLDVFLGDDSNSFVSWLWDHLTLNMDQYIESQKPILDETLESKAISAELDGTNIPDQIGSDKEPAELDKAFKKRHNMKWSGHTRNEPQPPSLQSYVVDEVDYEIKAPQSVCHTKRPFPLNSPAQRKRNRANEHKTEKEDETPKPIMSAPRRLIQFAVRDALATARPSSSLKKTRIRSLCSMVSPVRAQNDQPDRIQSTARVSSTIAAGVVPEDTRNAFHLLDHVGEPEIAGDVSLFYAVPDVYGEYYHQKEELQQTDYYYSPVEDQLVDYYDQSLENKQIHVEQGDYIDKYIGNATMLPSDIDLYSDYYHRKEEMQQIDYNHPQMDNHHQVAYYHGLENSHQIDVEQYSGENIGNATMLQSGTGLNFYYTSHNERYDGNRDYRVMDDRITGSSPRRKRDDSLLLQYSDQAQLMEKKSPVYAASSSSKIPNISMNANTWKPSHYKLAIDAKKSDTRNLLRQNEASVGKSSVRVMKKNKKSHIPTVHGKHGIQTLNGTQKSTTSGPGVPLEDANARTIFVNNVHFAASEDILSRQFGKFGKVLKVTILTDATTGQRKGSAYLEFMCKDAAESALILDGTSFMSRILKVVKKRSGKETSTAPCMSFVGARFPCAPFSGFVPGAYSARPPFKARVRSLQWKRGDQLRSHPRKSNAACVAGRRLTYIRSETKPTSIPRSL